MNTQAQRPAAFLLWDSAFFGARIARVCGARLDGAALDALNAWSAAEGIDCLYFLADARDAETHRLACSAGFAFVDVRVTLETGLPAPTASQSQIDTVPMRLAEASDIEQLKSIARESHHDSRFYFDGHFPRERCDALYAQWIEKSCRGDAGAVWVPGGAAEPEGYISCHLDNGGIGRIGLVAVAPWATGRGRGSALVRRALQWFDEQGAERATVVTQARNAAAMRMYQKCGFAVQATQVWYHKWFERAGLRDG